MTGNSIDKEFQEALKALENIGKDEGSKSFKPKTWRNISLSGSGNDGRFYVRIFKDSKFVEGRVFPFYRYGGKWKALKAAKEYRDAARKKCGLPPV